MSLISIHFAWWISLQALECIRIREIGDFEPTDYNKSQVTHFSMHAWFSGIREMNWGCLKKIWYMRMGPLCYSRKKAKSQN